MEPKKTVQHAFKKARLNLTRWRRIGEALDKSGELALAGLANNPEYAGALMLALAILDPPPDKIADVALAITRAVPYSATCNGQTIPAHLICGNNSVGFVGALAFLAHRPIAGVTAQADMRVTPDGFGAFIDVQGPRAQFSISFLGAGDGLPGLKAKLTNERLREIASGFGIGLHEIVGGEARPIPKELVQ